MAPLPMAAPSLHASLPNQKQKQKPSRSLLRRATVNGSGAVRTRDEAGLDLELSPGSTPPSPSKRARTVTFSPLVDEKLFLQSKAMTGFAPDLETVRVEVKLALEEHIRGGSDEKYDMLKEIFAPAKRGAVLDGPSNEKTRAYLLALTSFVSLLGKSCAGLVKAVLECEWMGREEGFVKIFVHFLGNLASAQGSYVGMILSTLVGKFTSTRLSSGRLEDCQVVNREVLVSRVHMALKYLLRLIPSASGTLAPILSAKFPFSEETKKVHMSYINSLLRVIEYAPELKAEIFALITERLVKIDVQMQTDLDDLDDEVAAGIVQAISLQPDGIEEDEDMDDDDESDTDTIASDEPLDDDASRVKEVQGNVEKMDAILDTLFSIYSPYFSDPNSAVAQNMFDTLLSHFRNIILPTYRSRHTQFLLFHFAQTSEHLVDTFAGECVELAFKSGRPAVLKQSAAAYLASFVARGARVPPHVVRDVFDYIGTCLDTIRDENEQTCRGPDLQRYGTFYATTQALLYIFCFRWRDLLISSDDDEVFDEDDPATLQHLEWHAGVKELLWRTIYSKLNPLKICAPSIVEEFARIAVRLDFMIVYPLLETNKRIRLSQFAFGTGGSDVLRESGFMNRKNVDGDDESWHMLDAYFPFDPYQLPVSRRWISSDYVEWKGIPGKDDRDDSTNGEDEEDGGVDLEDEDVDTATDEEDTM